MAIGAAFVLQFPMGAISRLIERAADAMGEDGILIAAGLVVCLGFLVGAGAGLLGRMLSDLGREG